MFDRGILLLPLAASLVLLPVFGVVLNGTSSATYGSVPHFAAPAERNRAFSWFYTGTLGAALAPTIAGFIGDIAGVTTTIVIVATLVLLTLPLSLRLRLALYTREAELVARSNGRISAVQEDHAHDGADRQAVDESNRLPVLAAEISRVHADVQDAAKTAAQRASAHAPAWPNSSRRWQISYSCQWHE